MGKQNKTLWKRLFTTKNLMYAFCVSLGVIGTKALEFTMGYITQQQSLENQLVLKEIEQEEKKNEQKQSLYSEFVKNHELLMDYEFRFWMASEIGALEGLVKQRLAYQSASHKDAIVLNAMLIGLKEGRKSIGLDEPNRAFKRAADDYREVRADQIQLVNKIRISQLYSKSVIAIMDMYEYSLRNSNQGSILDKIDDWSYTIDGILGSNVVLGQDPEADRRLFYPMFNKLFVNFQIANSLLIKTFDDAHDLMSQELGLANGVRFKNY
jgi:hypothetical protein